MITVRSIIYILFLLLIPLASIFGQELVLPDFNTNGLYLNAQVAADTNANGTRKDTNRVYVLKRGGIYLSNSHIDNNGYTLRIRGEYGSGEKPVIWLVQNTTSGAYPGRFVYVDHNVKLKNLLVTGVAEGDTAAMSHMPGGLLQTISAGWDIEIDSCILTNSSGNHVRTDQACRVIKVTNTVFGNMGYLGTSNLGAGKAFDLRAVSCDTLLIQNCSFINSQDRIIRHYTSTATINHLIFDHNTIVNAMAYHGLLSLGWVGAETRITNNLMIDPFALANDTDKTRQVEFATSERDPWNGNRMAWVFTDTTGGHSASTNYNISNNYYAISDSGRAFYTRYAGTSTGFPPMFNLPTEGSILTWYINKKVADSTVTFAKDNNIVLTKVPKLMTAMMGWYRSPAGGNKTKNTPTSLWSPAKYDYDRRTYQYYSDTLNCTFATTLPAYTGSLGGFPVGDLNWFPDKKAAWITWLTDVNDNNSSPVSFTLNQNYPNPFNPSTKITFSLKKSGLTTLLVYNILGEKIATLINSNLAAGVHEFSFNASKLSSGIYFYMLDSNGSNQVRKMMLLK
jgi:Secretion system C-terminal sorting domain